VPRTREGYYHTTGGIEAAVSRALAFAPYADMIWLETKTPDLKQAQSFARRIREKFPGKWLVYNLSPSFNWSAHGYSGTWQSFADLGTLLTLSCADADLKRFIWDLAKEGFVLQLVSLAGLHSNAVTFGVSSLDFGCSICNVQRPWLQPSLLNVSKRTVCLLT
jgi:isocitrate lyase